MRILIAAVVLLTPALALAGGYQVPNTNARDLGLAEATTSATEGAEATYVNSSTLALHPGLRVTLSGSLLNYTATWIDPAHISPSYTTHSHFVPPLVAAVSYGFKAGPFPMGIGLSLNEPGGGILDWPVSWPGANEIISVDRRVYQFTLGTGIQLLPQLCLGLSLLYFRTTEDLVQGIPTGSSPATTAELGTSGGRLSFAASLELIPIQTVPSLLIGFQYQHLAEQNLSGNVHFSNVPPPFQPLLIDQPVTHELTFPNIIHAGISYKFFDRVRLLFDYQFTRYIVYQQDLFVGSLGATVTVPRNYHNENTYRLAAEIFAVQWLRIYVGGRRDITPQPASTLSPTLPDSSSWAASLGVAVDVAKYLSVAASYEYTGFNQVSAVGPDAFPATYQSHANIGSLGVQLRWP